MVTMEVPLSSIDFTDCGDGDKEIYGLLNARIKDRVITSFHPDDVEVAEKAMKAALGYEEPRLDVYDRQADLREFADQEQARVMGDGFSKARDAR